MWKNRLISLSNGLPHGPEISGIEKRRKEFMEKAEWHR